MIYTTKVGTLNPRCDNVLTFAGTLQPWSGMANAFPWYPRNRAPHIRPPSAIPRDLEAQRQSRRHQLHIPLYRLSRRNFLAPCSRYILPFPFLQYQTIVYQRLTICSCAKSLRPSWLLPLHRLHHPRRRYLHLPFHLANPNTLAPQTRKREKRIYI